MILLVCTRGRIRKMGSYVKQIEIEIDRVVYRLSCSGNEQTNRKTESQRNKNFKFVCLCLSIVCS